MNQNAITVRTTVNAPLAKVWERWTGPEHIVNWAFASDDWEAPSAENDVREGGRFKTVMAAKDGDRLRLVAEVADLWFHCLVLLAHHGLGPDDVRAELARREGTSGIAEKAARKG